MMNPHMADPHKQQQLLKLNLAIEKNTSATASQPTSEAGSFQ
jgi:hypothetical protein